jgi:transcription initiation factor TFIIIB Brf1 subunit/transcription initiation factor TFIIB
LPELDIAEEEWLDLYRHLLAGLQERGFAEVRAEIEAAVSAPLVEESSPEEEARIAKIIRGEVGNATFRRRRPEEVFSAAVEVLQARLIELPTVAAALAQHLAVSPRQIEFRVDYEQRYALVELEPVRLERLIPSSQDTADLRAHLSEIGALVDSEVE